jgi:tetratricopeptide (TPR) repeat protein
MKYLTDKKMQNMKRVLSISMVIMLASLGCQTKKAENSNNRNADEFVTPLGKVYSLGVPSEKMLAQYEKAKQDFEQAPNKVDNVIWYGRRTAYLGRYAEAIQIYTQGIKQFPQEPRLYRHRGHRYISLRKYELAIDDLSKAGELIAGTENEIEQDGMPNAMNIPVSTLHGNIWYHLGLAYYLKHDYENSYMAYQKCLEASEMPDNVVSATHWLYMIQRRLGNTELAEQILAPIESGTDIVENTDYYNLCRFYKGLIPMDSLGIDNPDSPSSDALKYGVANWYFYNGNKNQAKVALEQIVGGKAWTSFGYIAAESDLLEYFGD